jgi:hypothetical protein
MPVDQKRLEAIQHYLKELEGFSGGKGLQVKIVENAVKEGRQLTKAETGRLLEIAETIYEHQRNNINSALQIINKSIKELS